MFVLQNKVPEVYINESRDFQLLCRLWEGSWAGVKYNLDTIISSLDPFNIKGEFLELLATKVGFFTDEDIEDNVLRYIISTFKYALRYKGSREGIRIAFTAILNSEHIVLSDTDIIIDINNKDHSITINSPEEVRNTLALREYLKYILPPGYTYTVNKYAVSDKNTSKFKHNDHYAVLNLQNAHLGLINKKPGTSIGFIPTKNTGGSLNNEVVGYQTGMFNTTQVVNDEDIKKGNYGDLSSAENTYRENTSILVSGESQNANIYKTVVTGADTTGNTRSKRKRK